MALSIAALCGGRVQARPVVRIAGEELLTRHSDRLDPSGWWLLAAFLVPFAPADAFSAIAALSRVSLRRFLLVSFLGRLPWATGTVLLAAGVVNGSLLLWVASGFALGALAAFGIAYRARSKRGTPSPLPRPLSPAHTDPVSSRQPLRPHAGRYGGARDAA